MGTCFSKPKNQNRQISPRQVEPKAKQPLHSPDKMKIREIVDKDIEVFL